MPPYDTGRLVAYPSPSYAQVALLVGAALLVLALLLYGPALVRLARAYLAYRAQRAEERRLETIEVNMRRSEWPQFAALPFNQRDVTRRKHRVYRLVKQPRIDSGIARLRAAGRGERVWRR